ncbi:MAG: tRNA (adenosine(37)-N6)-threonylcarbamoyltransferase complex ATPase subunit type 1 TsaE [Chakrabartia sp.]
MIEKTLILPDAQATHDAGQTLGAVVRAGDVVALSGDLGAGKTSLTRGILAELGLEEDAPSPSFALVIPYAPPQLRLPIWHVDLYRLDSPEDAEELGLDEALYDGALVIEWPERLAWLWPQTLRLHISLPADGPRRLTARLSPSWEDRWPFK